MGDGVNQTADTTQNCTNCNEQDTITIAGKTFCANCGTPQTSNTTTQAPAVTGQAASATPNLSVAPHESNIVQTSANSASTANAQPSEKMPAVGQAAQASPAAEPATDTVQTRLKADQLHSAISTSQSPSIAKFSDDTPTEPASDQGGKVNEIDSLDDKAGESVMSDETLDALAKTPADDPMPNVLPSEPPLEQAPKQSTYKLDLTQAASSTLPKAVSDIRPGQAMSQPAAVKPPTTPVMPTAAPIVAAPAMAAPAANISATQVAPAVANPVTNTMAQPTAAPIPAVASVADMSTPIAASQPAVANKGLKASSVALSLVGLLLLGGYVWQVNYPNLALKVAGSKAGISANFPGYVPSGWKLSGNIQSSPGNISYNIADVKSRKAIQVSESKTSWDSQALAENYVAPKSDNYLALQAQGLTIYLYDGNQASWVNNGTWYRIEGGDHGLSQDQIIKLATSL